MISVAQQVGAPRIVRVGRIPHPLGNPERTPERERELRRRIIETALRTLQTKVEGPTIFEVPEAIV